MMFRAECPLFLYGFLRFIFKQEQMVVVSEKCRIYLLKHALAHEGGVEQG